MSMDAKLEIRKLPPSIVKQFSLILDNGNSWKTLMAIIPNMLTNEFKCDISKDNPAKYNSEHFKIIEEGGVKYNRSCTEILFDEWGTSGRIRCSLGHLKYLLTKAQLFRAADYVAELLGEAPPPRPATGPAAKVTINPSEVAQYAPDPSTVEFEKKLDEINYPEVAIQQIRKLSIEVKHPVPVIPEIVVSEPRPEHQGFKIPLVVPKPMTQPEGAISDMIKFSQENVQHPVPEDSSFSAVMPDISLVLGKVPSLSESPLDNGHTLSNSEVTPALSQILPDSLVQTNSDDTSKSDNQLDTQSSMTIQSSIQSDIIPALSELNQHISNSISSEAESGLIPDFDLLQSGEASFNSEVPLTIPQASQSSNSISPKCSSPLPVLSLNTMLPHFTYSELEASTNNFSCDKESGRFLGAGAFGSVFLAIGLMDKHVAVKKISLENVDEVTENDAVTKQFKNEVELLYKYKHENLVSLLGYSCDGCTYCLVYEYVPGGSLLEVLEKNPMSLSWKQRLHIALGTAKAIAYLHTAFTTPLIHRDIKSANILLDAEKNAKLCDFGIVKLLPVHTDHLESAPYGTSAYMSPEYHFGDISVKLDTYSFGVVVLELLTSLPPMDINREPGDLISFVEDRCEETIDPLLDKSVGSWEENGVNFAQESYNLVLKCLKEKDERPLMMDVVEYLQDMTCRIVNT